MDTSPQFSNSANSTGKIERRCHPCLADCGGWTSSRYCSGCDSKFYARLLRATAHGDMEASDLLALTYYNNDPATFPEQRRRAKHWHDRQGSPLPTAAD